MSAKRLMNLPLLCAVLAGCQGGSDSTITSEQAEVYNGIAADETLNFGGNEPFWGGNVANGQLLYNTPENPDGTTIAVERFAGMNGLGFSGELNGQQFDMAVTPGKCSDTMSDRSYPFVVTLNIAGEQRNGCGWTEKMPFTGPENP